MTVSYKHYVYKIHTIKKKFSTNRAIYKNESKRKIVNNHWNVCYFIFLLLKDCDFYLFLPPTVSFLLTLCVKWKHFSSHIFVLETLDSILCQISIFDYQYLISLQIFSEILNFTTL